MTSRIRNTFGGLNQPAVDGGDAQRRLPPGGHADLGTQRIDDPLPGAMVAPRGEVVRDGRRGKQVVRASERSERGPREKTKVAAVQDEVVEATLPHVSPLVTDFIRVMRLPGRRPSESLGPALADRKGRGQDGRGHEANLSAGTPHTPCALPAAKSAGPPGV
jgi:hypothetical protein